MRVFYFLIILFCTSGYSNENALSPKFNFFLDSYFMYGVNQPNMTASYFTIPNRNNEFNINLALIKGEVHNDNFRANLGFHTGTSVVQYYINESPFSELMKLIHEANAGVQLFPRFWIEGGIFSADLAGESFISSKNLNYSHSMMADASPYFLNGVRANYGLTDSFKIGASLVNGYSMLETNGFKSVGVDLEYQPSQKFYAAYHLLIGQESRIRMLNNFVFKYKPTAFWDTNLLLALSFQEKPEGGHYAYWFTVASSHRFKLSDIFYLGGRVEYFFDKYQTLYVTNTLNGMQAFGGSLNLDTYLNKYLLWRVETRILQSMDQVFSSLAGPSNQYFTVTSSFSLTF